jgi:hypothetical protein
LRDDVIDQMRRRLRHAPRTASPTEPVPLEAVAFVVKRGAIRCRAPCKGLLSGGDHNGLLMW